MDMGCSDDSHVVSGICVWSSFEADTEGRPL